MCDAISFCLTLFHVDFSVFIIFEITTKSSLSVFTNQCNTNLLYDYFYFQQGYECTKRYLVDFVEKTMERDISKANDGVETTRAIVEPVVEEAELQVDAEIHINSSDSSDSGFSEMCTAEEHKFESGQIVKLEIVTTETTHLSYLCKDEERTRSTEELSRQTQNNKFINGHSISRTTSSVETEV